MITTTLVLAMVPKMAVVTPLVVVSLFLVVFIPLAARAGKLNIGTYGKLGVACLIVGLLMGQLSGASRVRGTALGVVVSVVFFLLIAVSAGSMISIFTYREPDQE
jgi:hypothetical protein